MKALVLAAGRSSRIAAHSQGLPKPLIRVGGEPILAHTLRWLARHNVRDIWINLHFKPELIREAIGDGSAFSVRVQYAHEPEILGTAGAVKNLEAEWSEPFYVVYGDNLLDFDLSAMAAMHCKTHAIATIAVFDWERDAHSGIAGGRVLLDEKWGVAGFLEGGSTASSKWVNAGVYVCDPAICKEIPAGRQADFGKNIFPRLLERRAVLMGFPIQSFCLAVDTPEALAEAEKKLSEIGRRSGARA